VRSVRRFLSRNLTLPAARLNRPRQLSLPRPFRCPFPADSRPFQRPNTPCDLAPRGMGGDNAHPVAADPDHLRCIADQFRAWLADQALTLADATRPAINMFLARWPKAVAAISPWSFSSTSTSRPKPAVSLPRTRSPTAREKVKNKPRDYCGYPRSTICFGRLRGTICFPSGIGLCSPWPSKPECGEPNCATSGSDLTKVGATGRSPQHQGQRRCRRRGVSYPACSLEPCAPGSTRLALGPLKPRSLSRSSSGPDHSA